MRCSPAWSGGLGLVRGRPSRQEALLGLPQVVVIPGASSVEQLEFNVAAADLDLAPDEQQALTAAARTFTPVSAGRTFLDSLRERF